LDNEISADRERESEISLTDTLQKGPDRKRIDKLRTASTFSPDGRSFVDEVLIIADGLLVSRNHHFPLEMCSASEYHADGYKTETTRNHFK
jgi:hypothetical protein